ncbi:hypothetical protein THAOC_02358, partial [Thalassiosira oceanica]
SPQTPKKPRRDAKIEEGRRKLTTPCRQSAAEAWAPPPAKRKKTQATLFQTGSKAEEIESFE